MNGAIQKGLCVDTLYESVCKWVNASFTVTRVERSIRLEKLEIKQCIYPHIQNNNKISKGYLYVCELGFFNPKFGCDSEEKVLFT